MKGACYILAIAMTIGWLLGVMMFKTGGIIHILLIAAAIAWIQGIIICPKTNRGKLTIGQQSA
jgi:hypothetical protein